MKKTLLSLLMIVIVLALLVFVWAEETNTLTNQTENNITVISPGISNETVKNLTYGLCVTNLTKSRNQCYKSTDEIIRNCKQNKTEMSCNNTEKGICKKEARGLVADCGKNYKDAKNSCKQQFKDSKVVCKQYKKTFADRIRFWQ